MILENLKAAFLFIQEHYQFQKDFSRPQHFVGLDLPGFFFFLEKYFSVW